MAIAIAIIISVAALLYVFSRMSNARTEAAAPQEKAPRQSRRQRKLDKLREMDPLPEPRSMFDIMMEEAAELGVDEIPGGEGLEVPVKLKVFRRDARVREECTGVVRFAIVGGVEPAHATVDDVRLLCEEDELIEAPAPNVHGEPASADLADQPSEAGGEASEERAAAAPDDELDAAG